MLIPFAFLRLKKNKDSAGRIRHFASITLAVICVGSILVSLAGCGSTRTRHLAEPTRFLSSSQGPTMEVPHRLGTL